jgi:glycosyltransferase involved in cell wall biosynthesis
MRRVLLVAFHFPPIQGSSGVHRTLAFARYLYQYGWQATVLAAHSRAFPSALDANLQMIPAHVEVVRAPAWDAARHFSIAGRYPDVLARPDRWASWIPFGVLAGMRELRRKRYDALFSTFPISSAHVIGRALARRSGLPWIADFRDPMASATYPPEPALNAQWTRIQDRVIDEAARITVTAPGAVDFYRERYPRIDASKLVVIPNGFDPETFGQHVPAQPAPTSRDPNAPLLLLHSGVMYPRERDPGPFFRALRKLRSQGQISAASVQVRLRASGSEEHYARMIAEHEVGDIVTLAPSLPYGAAIEEMASADALLLFQARVCNQQIPAKAYEYLYMGRPILTLADPAGDTAQLMSRFDVAGIAALEEEDRIAAMLLEQLPRIRAGQYAVAPRAKVMTLSRQSGAQELARQLDAVATGGATRARKDARLSA